MAKKLRPQIDRPIPLRQKPHALRVCSVRLFDADVRTLHNVATKNGTKWQMELRLLVRRALKGRNLKLVEY